MPSLSSIGVVRIAAGAFALSVAVASYAQTGNQHPSFEIQTHRMDVDVDGAPNAYGPPGKQTLDILLNAHYLNRADLEIVGYLTDEHRRPILQGPNDPFPGYYISQTAFADIANQNEKDPRRYVDARNINYVVRGDAARRRGVKVGDFVSVYSKRTRKGVFAIVGDTGNPTGDEGSLHLLQNLGYPFHDGIGDSVEKPEIVVRFYPNSNQQHQFFFTQAELNEAAAKLGLSRDFSGTQSSAENQTSAGKTQARSFWVDPSTGLMWGGRDNGKDVSWKSAVKYCRNLRLAGYFDWRLATLSELEGIYDKNANAPGLARLGGPAKGSDFTWHVKGNLFLTGDEWSSERRYDDRGHPSGYEWYFNFNEGRSDNDPSGWPYSNDGMRALCVRGSGK